MVPVRLFTGPRIYRTGPALRFVNWRNVKSRSKRQNGLRTRLLADLRTNRDAEHERRRATLRRVVAHVNEQAAGLRVHLAVDAGGDRAAWCDWLREKLSFRSPEWSGLRKLSPRERLRRPYSLALQRACGAHR